MIKIKALNEFGSSSSDEQSQSAGITREAQEESLYQMYSEALRLMAAGDSDSARQLLVKLNDLLNSKSINQKVPFVHQLKYLTLKNLGLISTKDPINYLLDALEIDPSDVTLWIKTGQKAAQQGNYQLARNCYEEAHKMSPENWIAIDKLLDTYFILHDLYSCFKLACAALDLDKGYRKARILLTEICKLHPPLIKELDKKRKPLINDAEDEEYNFVIGLLRQTKLKRRQMFEDERAKQEAKRPKLVFNLDIGSNKTIEGIGERIFNLHQQIKKLNIFPSTPIEISFDDSFVNQNQNQNEVSCESGGGSANTSADEGTNTCLEQKENDKNDKEREKTKERKTSSSRGNSMSGNFPLEFLDKRRSSRVKSLLNRSVDIDQQSISDSILEFIPDTLKTPPPEESGSEFQNKIENKVKFCEADVTKKLIELFKLIKTRRKCIRIYDLIEEYLKELSVVKGAMLPSVFTKLYLTFREKNELPCAAFCKIGQDITLKEIWTTLTANEMKYNKLEAMFLTQMVVPLEYALSKDQFLEFVIRLSTIRGIKENDNDSLKYALELLNESVGLEVIATNRMTINTKVIKSLLESQSRENLSELMHQAKYNDIIKLLKSKPESELTSEEEKLLSEAIIHSEMWKEGIEMFSMRNELNNICLKTIKTCLETGHRARLNYHLTFKLVKLAASGNSVLPWICLYWGIVAEENATKPKCNLIKFLKLGHHFLGKRGICTGHNGEFILVLLQYFIDNEVDDNEIIKCFTCLYNFPPKKLSATNSSNHNSSTIKLKWENCEILYNYFTPEDLPEYDSIYRLTGISSEIEALLLRIADLVPEQLQGLNNRKMILDYIESGEELPNDFSPETNPITETLYYFLADYYFKNKEFKKASDFYLKDLGLNSNRFDSWAGAALSRSSQLEQQLISGDNIEIGFYRHAASALRCFERALKLDTQNNKLWIEFGNLAYNISSHSSRLRKTALFMQSPSGTHADQLQVQHEEMLNIAKCCFESANNTDATEEVWLPYYMLGKVLERKNLLIAIKYYEWAEMCLYADGTSYPRKIQYHNPPALAVEALEIHYRIHAATLKLVTSAKKCSARYLRRLKTHLIRALKSPFAKQFTPSSATSVAPVDHDYATGGDSSVGKLNGKIKDSVKELVDDLIDVVVEREQKFDIATLKNQIINLCLNAMKRCLNRYPAHYKSLYRLAHYYHMINDNQTAKSFLLGGPSALTNPKLAIVLSEVEANSCELVQSSQDLSKVGIIPGLFAEKKTNNLFNGIWRIPIDDIDRPGSFSSHMFRSTFLLIRVCTLTHDYQTLCTIAQQLSRTPEVGKKYLRDADRQLLARFSFESCVLLLKSHLQNPIYIGREKIMNDVQRIADRFIKANVFVNEANALIRELFQMTRR